MKIIENLLLKACGYTILILTILYSFAAFDNSGNSGINFETFALIFIFGIIVSVATMILGAEKLPVPLRILVHYASLLIVFCVVFIGTGRLIIKTPANAFVAIIMFTLFYASIFAVVYLIRKIVKSADKKIDNKKAKNSSYKSIYSDK